MAAVTFALAAVGTAILHFTYTTENFNKQQAARVITRTQQTTDTHVTDRKGLRCSGMLRRSGMKARLAIMVATRAVGAEGFWFSLGLVVGMFLLE